MMMLIVDLLLDGLFAALAAMGFGAISDPPLKAYGSIALLAAVGHALRFFLMTVCGINIAIGSLCASLTIGFGALWLGKRIRTPITVLSIPALLPMIPGKFAYKMFVAQIMFLQNLGSTEGQQKYMEMFFFNTMVAVTVIFVLAAGATLPILLFPKRTFSLTRKKQ